MFRHYPFALGIASGEPVADVVLWMRLVAQRGTQGLVVLTGDIHRSWAADLKQDPRGRGGPITGWSTG